MHTSLDIFHLSKCVSVSKVKNGSHLNNKTVNGVLQIILKLSLRSVPQNYLKFKMKLGMRVSDKMGYEFSCILQGNRHGKSPKESGAWWRLLIWTERQLLMVEFCSFVALLKMLSITLARAVKPFTYSVLCLGR